ncbi:hypothetical protein [uncultured Roseovarius sp.]|uniref:hypothetical protein n=1 Tax=uncultured Roseovarius sp. TaxID=293344 RepID=UPI002620F68C|nr:hypothetical protein [uncultured Roseovarius sp.]
MAFSSHTTPREPFLGNISRLALAPFRAVDSFFQSIITANQVVRDVEYMSQLSDAKLAKMGVNREDIVTYVARKSGTISAV